MSPATASPPRPQPGWCTGEGWLLHAGDAYFMPGDMGQGRRRCPPLARYDQRLMEVDRRARLWNKNRLRRLSVEP